MPSHQTRGKITSEAASTDTAFFGEIAGAGRIRKVGD